MAKKAEVEAEVKASPRTAIADLIVKLCEDVTGGKSRDEFKAMAAIAELYTAIKE